MEWFSQQTPEFLWFDKADSLAENDLLDAWKKRQIKAFPWPAGTGLKPELSGCAAYPRTEEIQTQLSDLVHQAQVLRRFSFLTDRSTPVDETFFEDSATDLRLWRMKRSPFFELWEGETRLPNLDHARQRLSDLQRGVLGDVQFGGSPFARVCFHITRLEIPGLLQISSAPPRLFERLGLLRSSLASQALTALDRRQRVYHFIAPSRRQEDITLIDFDIEGLRLERRGSELILQWFHREDPTARELETWAAIGRIVGLPLTLERFSSESSAPRSGDSSDVLAERLRGRI